MKKEIKKILKSEMNDEAKLDQLRNLKDELIQKSDAKTEGMVSSFVPQMISYTDLKVINEAITNIKNNS